MPRRDKVSAPATKLIGRSADLATLSAAFAGGDRLITVTGPPGTGKTTCARAFGSQLEGSVIFCDLSEARDGADLSSCVARAIGGEPSQLDDALAVLDALLILDNFEQLVAHAAVVGRWLAIGSELRILVTSRERLRIPGEVALPLSPLGLPPADEDDAAVICESDAVQLLIDRARRVRRDFAPRPEAERLRDIVRELDGLPLAIELAAARLAVLSPADLLARLSRRFEVLSSGARDAGARHSTLRAAIDWSWMMLDATEQEALALLSVFRGGFTLDAADAVLARAGTLDLIQTLHDKSLLHAYDAPEERRIGMYSSIAEYARERLAERPAEREQALRRFRDYFLCRKVKLSLEQHNLTAVVEDALARKDGADALEALLVLDPLRSAQGPIDAHAALLDRAIELAQGCDPVLLARAYDARARARALRARTVESRADFERAIELATGDLRVCGQVLSGYATLLRQQGEVERSESLYASALEALRAAGDRAGEGAVLGALGIAYKERGQLAEARRNYEAALVVLEDVGDRRAEGRVRCDLGALHQEERRFDEALRSLEVALAIHREIGDRRLEAIALSDLGAIAFETDKLADAERHYRASIEILREVGDRRYEALFTGALGGVEAALGRIDDAGRSFERAEAFFDKANDVLFQGAVTVHRGHLDLALAKLAAAGGAEDEAERCYERARERGPAAAELSSRSDDVRFALRALEAAMDRAPSLATNALVLGPGAAWFRAPGSSERIDLGKRTSARRLLLALVARRIEAPGAALDLEALKEHGWPGEQLLRQALANRVHVTLASLRADGLKSVLLRSEQGYLLDPNLPILRVLSP